MASWVHSALGAITLLTVLCLSASAQAAAGSDGACQAPAPEVPELLEAVQQQQQQASEQRARWSFDQHVLVRMLRSRGRLAREELRHYRVQPTPDSVKRELQSLEGKVNIKGTEYPYDDPKYRTGDIDLDGELVEAFAEDMLFHKKRRDGVDGNMYPLSEKMVGRHRFTMHGEESFRDRQVYKLTFEPLSKKESKGEAGFWEGEVLVDCATLAPVLVTTHQARNVPIVIRTMLGSNVKQVGFKLEYAQMPDGEWFPVRYSGEFDLRVLFGYSRRIGLSLRNENFQRASADDVIRYHLEDEVAAEEGAAEELGDPAGDPNGRR
jgi:hypothetical protein